MEPNTLCFEELKDGLAQLRPSDWHGLRFRCVEVHLHFLREAPPPETISDEHGSFVGRTGTFIGHGCYDDCYASPGKSPKFLMQPGGPIECVETMRALGDSRNRLWSQLCT